MTPESGTSLRRSGLVRATVVLLILLALVGVLLTAFGGTLFELSETTRLIVGLLLAIVPAVLWLGLFYAQDHLEPEPHHYVVGLFVLGGLLGGAVEQPLLRDFLKVQLWAPSGILSELLANIFVHGLLTAALVYVAVRFTVLPTPEFDERVDGIIYGTSVALGLGIAANLTYLFDHGTVSIGVGTMQVIVTSLAYATFGALVGYFLGLVKPGGAPPWYAGLGVLVTAVVHGLYLYVSGLFSGASTGLSYNPWPTLISTTVFAVLVFAVVFLLIRRAVGRTATVEGASA
ncbi:PrsW family glutamic-type intramembrane protease [Mycobacterium sp. pV006]|uniref:PrsW family glutamic-type intramembrane protease n=1 Tax=Mycobacterium sp. pV006 TaxID=3238983 RepID=UPI00351B90BA